MRARELDALGRAVRPVFAEADGAPADVDGRPMGQAARALGSRLKAVADEMSAPAAVSSLQRALNGLSDEQVRAETPKDGTQARRKIPKLLIDGVLGPKTSQAARLALHQLGERRVAGGSRPIL